MGHVYIGAMCGVCGRLKGILNVRTTGFIAGGHLFPCRVHIGTVSAGVAQPRMKKYTMHPKRLYEG